MRKSVRKPRSEEASNLYIFCIDTEAYAGNFERSMCAFLTGMVGECEVGQGEAKTFVKEGYEPLVGLVTKEPDEHGCYRPVAIQATPGWFNDGEGNHYRESNFDATEVLYKHNASVRAYAKSIEKSNCTDKSYTKREASRHRKNHLLTKFSEEDKQPAYNSVGIFMSCKPTKKELVFLKKRAFIYAKSPTFEGEPVGWLEPFEIEGFRLVTRRIIDDSEVV